MGDFHKFERPDAGSHTVEGNVSGARAAKLEKERLEQQEKYELEKQKRRRLDDRLAKGIDGKFQQARIGSVEENAFRQKTVGLVTAHDFMKAQKEMDDTEGQDRNKANELSKEELQRKQKAEKKAKKKKRKEKRKAVALLSFGDDENEGLGVDGDDGDDDSDEKNNAASESPSKKAVSLKDPTIDTSFLPDKQREQQSVEKREQLEKEWKLRQTEMKKEKLEITYSYWDGSGHRRTCTITKGSSVADFLEIVRKDLQEEFKELSKVASDGLLYVKEDLILPHDITFYDLIVTKARGKSGPLFHFDVHEDVRLGPLDVRIEKDESHPGKVIERRWYERNKHIFPASRWEIYDPLKEYGTYTIHGGEVNKK